MVTGTNLHRLWQTATFVFLILFLAVIPAQAQTDDASPPPAPVKLIFIHHSCGQNLLTDDNGGLGLALADNNYFVSDTNYGWGPDSIGDRTDITDWPEWFTGPESSRYLNALYNESGQNSWYTRRFADPGGENQIVMFKSCYPNSNLWGNPDDPPQRGEGMTVGNAKAIYNELLTYFSTRPDKLFVAVTAPPVQSPDHADNARAFNTWLTTEWLAGYSGSNVAVFDFYNVLTGEENHHRFVDGRIQYITDQGRNVHAYPSGDNHPSAAGNRKAAAEFVPLLNVYYHRWQSGEPPESIELGEEAAATAVPPAHIIDNLIDDFEHDEPVWDAYGDANTTITCGPDEADAYSGTAALRIEYDTAADGWAGCGRTYAAPQNWSEKQGIVVYVRAAQTGQPVTITGLQGQTSDDLLLFMYQTVTNQEAVDGWQRIDVLWEQMIAPSWQGNEAAFDPAQAIGVAFMFEGAGNGRHTGTLWVDDVSFLAAAPAPAVESTATATMVVELVVTSTPVIEPEVTAVPVVEPAETDPTPVPADTAVPEPELVEDDAVGESNGRAGLCPGTATMGLITVVAAAWVTTKQKKL